MNWIEYSDLITEKCKKSRTPFYACFELTPFCNFRCNMCYIRLDKKQASTQGNLLSTEQWIDLAKSARKMGSLSLELTGGEPTTREDFKLLYKSFIEMGYLIMLRTNGYLIDQDYIELFKAYRPYQISITIYGSSDDTYQKICGIPDGFSKVTSNILALKEAGITPRLTMTITTDNAKDVKEVKLWAAQNGLNIGTYGGLITPIRGANRSISHLKIRYTDEECAITSDMKFLPHQVENRPKYMNPFWMCRGYGAEFCVSWDGRMTLCNGLTAIWSDPISNEFKEAYYSLYNQLDKVKRPERCETCQYIEYCGACPSRLLSATGRCEETCEETCRIARRNYKCYLLDDGSGHANSQQIKSGDQL